MGKKELRQQAAIFLSVGEGKEPALQQIRCPRGEEAALQQIRLVAGKGRERCRVSQGGKGRQCVRRSNGRRVGAAARVTDGEAVRAEGGEEQHPRDGWQSSARREGRTSTRADGAELLGQQESGPRGRFGCPPQIRDSSRGSTGTVFFYLGTYI
jgi:hypothetical protein